MTNADVVVIGSGPSAYSVTLSLLRKGRKVAVIPGGGWKEENHSDTLEGAESQSIWGHEPLQTHRRAAIGGAGDLWGGRSVLFDKIDFSKRDWVPHSGWPIQYREYLSFYNQAAQLLGIETIIDSDAKAAVEVSKLEDSNITVSDGGIELWSRKTKFSEMWKHLVKTEPGLFLLNGAYCIRISVDSRGHVEHVNCISSNNSFEVRGGKYVVAAGALENARLLMNAGYEKSLPSLGRYYMSHLWFTSYEFGGQPLPSSFDLKRVGVNYGRRRWRLSDGAQEKHQLLNAIGFAGKQPANPLSMHEKATRQNPNLPDDYRLKVAGNRTKAVSRFTRSLLWSHKGVFPVGQFFLGSLLGSKKPVLLPSRRYGHWALWFQGEHAPNPSSRVVLTNLRDSTGNRKVRADINFSEIDFHTAAKFHELFDSLATTQGFVRFSGNDFSPDRHKELIAGEFNSNAHQAGTTRMGITTQFSVVDLNCKVHTSDNLYIAGSSVFPTSSHANPTLSIVMLSIRLGEHLVDITGS